MLLSLFFCSLTLLGVSVARPDNVDISTWTLVYGRSNPQIVGGNPAVEGQFPWQVSITDRGTFAFCGGAVLTHSFVLTAAHCLINQDVKKIVLTFGSLWSLHDNITRRAAELIVHDAFVIERPFIIHDVGLVRLDSTLPDEWTATLAPISLPRRSLVSLLDNEMVVASGWGRTSSQNPFGSPILRWASLPVLPLATCAEKIEETLKLHVNQSHICSDTSRGQSTFKGDSGGSIIWRDSANVSRVVGIVSFGSPTAVQGVPNVFTRVSQYLDWLQEHSDVVIEP